METAMETATNQKRPLRQKSHAKRLPTKPRPTHFVSPHSKLLTRKRADWGRACRLGTARADWGPCRLGTDKLRVLSGAPFGNAPSPPAHQPMPLHVGRDHSFKQVRLAADASTGKIQRQTRSHQHAHQALEVFRKALPEGGGSGLLLASRPPAPGDLLCPANAGLFH